MLYTDNRQNSIEVTDDLINIINEVCDVALKDEEVTIPYQISLLFVDNNEIREINNETRGIDKVTDVLSFPMIDFEKESDFSHVEEAVEDYFNPETGELILGDIIVSVEKVIEQAEKYGHSRERELAFLIAHSMLHLCGYDHMEDAEREVMETRQREILAGEGYHR